MPDLLTHALVAYVLATALAWRVGWLTRPYVTVAMAGAFIPDLAKVALVVPSVRVEAALGVPFDWFALHTLGGASLSVLVGVLVVGAARRRRVGALLALGAGSHLFLDALLRNPSGFSYPVLWPLSGVQPPTPGLYLSTDVWPAVVAILLAGGVWLARRHVDAAQRGA